MDEIIKKDNNLSVEKLEEENSIVNIGQEFLIDARSSIENKKKIKVPIAELATLGGGVSSIIPALNTVTQTININAEGLYTLANAGVGDVLKATKNGNFWGALKTAEGTSKLAKLNSVGSISGTTVTVAAANPAVILAAVALFSIEQEIAKIENMQKQIISFLEIEKESEVEADVEYLVGIIKKYKDNWDNKQFITGNHTQVLIIQNRARKNIIGFQKKIAEIIEKKKIIVAQNNVKKEFSDLEKKFKYYRLSLYIFSLSTLLEIMLSGNFKESYITSIKNEIQEMTKKYRHQFEKSSYYLEKLGSYAIESNVLKGVGTAGKAVGKLIGSIPLIKDGPVDEFLHDGGLALKKNAIDMEKEAVHNFAVLNNPGTRVFMDKMEDMIQIYNHTDRICFDNNNIYLVSDH